jgi:hypothetical protein
MLRGSFIYDLIAFVPWQFIFPMDEEDPENQILRNVLLLKMIRLSRVGRNFIPDKQVAKCWSSLQKANSKDDEIAQ